MKAPVQYIQDFIGFPGAAFEDLKQLEWERRENTPRAEYYINDFPEPYTYGRGRGQRQYLPRPKPILVGLMQEKLFHLTGFRFEVCFLNRYYDQKDQLGWHADDSPEMDDARPIAVISLGAEREIWFRPKERLLALGVPIVGALADRFDGTEVERLKLASGSLCLMAPGMQDTHQHRIPKADRTVGERISLTFRGYVPQVKP